MGIVLAVSVLISLIVPQPLALILCAIFGWYMGGKITK
jgi:hypothetical protein